MTFHQNDHRVNKALKNPEHIVKNMVEVARHFGKTKRTIVNWGKKGMPMIPEGFYDLDRIAAWAFDLGLIPEIPGGSSADSGKSPGKQFYETELRRLQAELKRLELEKEIGKLIPVEEVEAGRIARVMAVKRALLAIPRGMAPLLTGMETREIEAVLMEKMRELIIRFSGGDLDAS